MGPGLNYHLLSISLGYISCINYSPHVDNSELAQQEREEESMGRGGGWEGKPCVAR